MRWLPLVVIGLLGGCGLFQVDWAEVERDIKAEWPGVVLSVEHDAVDDFLVITVDEDTTEETSVELSCGTVVRVLNEVNSVALFAVYSEAGGILSSWNRCDLAPSPSP